MADRVPIYELHVKPLFRLIDREHMSLFFDLGDYDSTKQNATAILGRLQSGMPPSVVGGPWPAELISMFQRWVTAGCPRLALGRGSSYQLTKAGTSYHLQCSVDLPGNDARSWLDILDTNPAHRSYQLYIEPGTGNPVHRTVSDDFDEAADVSVVYVVDIAGTQTVQIMPA